MAAGNSLRFICSWPRCTALSNGVGLAPALATGGGGGSSASSIGSGTPAGFGASGTEGTEGTEAAFDGVETAFAGVPSRGRGLDGATRGRGATGWRVGAGRAVAGLTAATASGGGGTRFHGFQTARPPPRPSTTATATSTAVGELLAGWAGPAAGFTGWVGATVGTGTSRAVGAPEKAAARARENSPQLVKRSDGVLARAFARTASTYLNARDS